MKNSFDAILIPGGGMRAGGQVPLWVINRLNRAIEIHDTGYIITLSGGTIHKPPPLDKDGYPVFESVAAARYLVEKGIDPERILSEIASYDTIGNAYFSRMIHTEPRSFKRLLVITSQFHMARTKEIFQWVFGLPFTRSSGSKRNNPSKLFFETVPDIDEGIDEGARQMRTEKEKKGLERILKFRKEITTLVDFHRWMYTKHGAYAAATAPVRLTGSILQSY
ncbi:MAG: YdcF family protein [bacterium]|nr:YdcF family protein [bacterium]